MEPDGGRAINLVDLGFAYLVGLCGPPLCCEPRQRSSAACRAKVGVKLLYYGTCRFANQKLSLHVKGIVPDAHDINQRPQEAPILIAASVNFMFLSSAAVGKQWSFAKTLLLVEDYVAARCRAVEPLPGESCPAFGMSMKSQV